MTATLQAPTKANPAPALQGGEDIEDPNSGDAKRGRGAAPDKNYGTIFAPDKLQDAKSNPPLKDGDTVDGFRLYKIAPISAGDKFKSENEAEVLSVVSALVWGRNQQQALAFYGETLYLVDTFDRKTRTTKIDPIYVQYLGMAIKTGMYNGLDTIFNDDERYYQYVVDMAGVDDATFKADNEGVNRFATQAEFKKFLDSAEAKSYVASKATKAA